MESALPQSFDWSQTVRPVAGSICVREDPNRMSKDFSSDRSSLLQREHLQWKARYMSSQAIAELADHRTCVINLGIQFYGIQN